MSSRPLYISVIPTLDCLDFPACHTSPFSSAAAFTVPSDTDAYLLEDAVALFFGIHSELSWSS